MSSSSGLINIQGSPYKHVKQFFPRLIAGEMLAFFRASLITLNHAGIST